MVMVEIAVPVASQTNDTLMSHHKVLPSGRTKRASTLNGVDRGWWWV
jgi:hypothetical protein